MAARKKAPRARAAQQAPTTRASASRRAAGKAQPKTRAREPGKRLSSSERRAQIIEAVEELFKTRPYGEIGVPEVAQLVGITQGLVYHYFPSKEALLVAAVKLRARELLRFCLPDKGRPFLDQVETAVKGYIDYVEAHSLAYANLFKGPSVAEPAILRICEQTRLALIDHFLDALGLVRLPLAATRLALRGYIGYSETIILHWLERRQVPRAAIERMCFAGIASALKAGLGGEPSLPLTARQLSTLESSFRRRFDLS
jgi:AcrR family transcriptional regulator